MFLAYRPWLLLTLLLAPGLGGAAERAGAAASAVLVASVSETLLVVSLGAHWPWAEALRATGAGLLLAGLLAALTAVARRVDPRRWRWLTAALGIGLLALPETLALHERLALRAVTTAPPATVRLAILTGLPLRWSGEGVADTFARDGGQASWRGLAASFVLRPLDRLDEESLAGEQMLLLAQPRDPGPAGLVALDRWVRGGGRLLLLVDPVLRWPGDPRALPSAGGLAPLLAHWGLTVEVGQPGTAVLDVGRRRIVVDAPGRFTTGGPCWLLAEGLAADCRIGAGQVMLLADADLLHDRLWVGPGAWGEDRRGRTADNLPLLLNWLDALAGKKVVRDDGIAWARVGAELQALALAVIFAASTLVLGVWLRGR